MGDAVSKMTVQNKNRVGQPALIWQNALRFCTLSLKGGLEGLDKAAYEAWGFSGLTPVRTKARPLSSLMPGETALEQETKCPLVACIGAAHLSHFPLVELRSFIRQERASLHVAASRAFQPGSGSDNVSPANWQTVEVKGAPKAISNSLKTATLNQWHGAVSTWCVLSSIHPTFSRSHTVWSPGAAWKH